MTEHYPKNCCEASAWCPKCQKRTQHRVDKGIVGPCLDCIAKYDNRVQAEVFDLDELRKKLSPRQAGLFGDAT
jgi:ribosomal protein L37AE/L43A